MIETIIRDFLGQQLEIPVLLEEEGESKNFVLIEKTGSSINNVITTSTVVIQSYAHTLAETAILNDLVKKMMEDMIELEQVTKVVLNTDYNFPDTAKKRYRYQAVYHITHY